MKHFEEYIAKQKKKYIIFDFDETLFQLHLNWEQYFDDIRADLKALDRQLFEDYEAYRISANVMQNKFIAKHGEKAKRILAEKNRHMEKKLLFGVTPNYALLASLPALQHVEKYVWSSNGRDVIEEVLKKYEMLDHFEKIISRTEVGMIKPHPEGFEYIKRPYHEIKDFVFVGDSLADKGAAEALGMDFYLIDYFHQLNF